MEIVEYYKLQFKINLNARFIINRSQDIQIIICYYYVIISLH